MAQVNQAKAEAAKSCFSLNPLINTVFVTSDLSCFAVQNIAVNHARKLDDKDIDVFIRNQDEAVIDADQSSLANAELGLIPDVTLAQAKRFGVAGDTAFLKVPDAVATSPADYAAAKSLFSELYLKWNGLTVAEKESAEGVALHAQIDGLFELTTKYEAGLEPTAAPATVVDPAAAPAAPATVADAAAVAPADPATVADPAAAPVDPTTIVDPAAAPVDPTTVVDAAAAPVDPTTVVDAAAPVDPTTVVNTAAAAPATDENITDKITELVDEVEALLHLKDKTV